MHPGSVKYVSTTPSEMALEAVVNSAASFHINLWNVALCHHLANHFLLRTYQALLIKHCLRKGVFRSIHHAVDRRSDVQ